MSSVLLAVQTAFPSEHVFILMNIDCLHILKAIPTYYVKWVSMCWAVQSSTLVCMDFPRHW